MRLQANKLQYLLRQSFVWDLAGIGSKACLCATGIGVRIKINPSMNTVRRFYASVFDYDMNRCYSRLSGSPGHGCNGILDGCDFA